MRNIMPLVKKLVKLLGLLILVRRTPILFDFTRALRSKRFSIYIWIFFKSLLTS